MSRLIYSLLFYLAMPLVWLRLLWRARRQPEYLQQLGERHGFMVRMQHSHCSGCTRFRWVRRGLPSR